MLLVGGTCTGAAIGRRNREGINRMSASGARGPARALVLTAALALTPGISAAQMLGDTQVLAAIPSPGFPEGIAVKGHTAYVSTPSRSGTAGEGPSEIMAFDTRTGQLVRDYAIQNEDLSLDHSLNGIAFARGNDLCILSPQLGIVRLNVKSGAQDVYAAPLPDLPRCAAVPAGTPCSPTAADSPPLPNDIVFDREGNAYITDSNQATIFRVPRGGGQPQIWFQDAGLDGVVGPNGIRVTPDRKRIVFAVSFDVHGTGAVYTLPLVAQPAAADLAIFHQYAAEAPDDMAFGRSGKLYVSLALSNQISVLDPSGGEITRYSGPASSGLPLDSPSGVAFNNATRSLLVNNHALFSLNAQNMVVFEIFADDRGKRLARPRLH